MNHDLSIILSNFMKASLKPFHKMHGDENNGHE